MMKRDVNDINDVKEHNHINCVMDVNSPRRLIPNTGLELKNLKRQVLK